MKLYNKAVETLSHLSEMAVGLPENEALAVKSYVNRKSTQLKESYTAGDVGQVAVLLDVITGYEKRVENFKPVQAEEVVPNYFPAPLVESIEEEVVVEEDTTPSAYGEAYTLINSLAGCKDQDVVQFVKQLNESLDIAFNRGQVGQVEEIRNDLTALAQTYVVESVEDCFKKGRKSITDIHRMIRSEAPDAKARMEDKVFALSDKLDAAHERGDMKKLQAACEALEKLRLSL